MARRSDGAPAAAGQNGRCAGSPELWESKGESSPAPDPRPRRGRSSTTGDSSATLPLADRAHRQHAGHHRLGHGGDIEKNWENRKVARDELARAEAS